MKKLLMGSELFFLHAKDCSDGQGMPARNVFMGCVECSGAKGCPRNEWQARRDVLGGKVQGRLRGRAAA